MAWIQENLLSLLLGTGLVFFLAVTVALTSRERKGLCGCSQRSEAGCSCAQEHLEALKGE